MEFNGRSCAAPARVALATIQRRVIYRGIFATNNQPVRFIGNFNTFPSPAGITPGQIALTMLTAASNFRGICISSSIRGQIVLSQRPGGRVSSDESFHDAEERFLA